MCTITHQLCLIHPSSTVYSSLAPAQRQTLSPLYSSNLTWRSSQSLCTGDLRTRLKKQFSMWKEGRQSKIRQTNALSEAEHKYSFNEKAPLVTTIIPQGNSAAIHLFGVQHCERQSHIAEYILRTNPSAVLVETAITTRHGSNTGNVIHTDDQIEVQHLQADFYARMFYQLGSQLQNDEEPWTSSTWKSLACQFGGEQLAYIAAFATKAALIFGDRPKEATFQRLYALPSLLELDAAFSHQSALNYQEQLTGSPAVTDWSASPSEPQDIVEQIMMRERDYILAQILRDAALTAGPGNTVVGVIGEAHLAGVQYLLQHGEWLTHEELQDLSSAPTAERCVDSASIGVRLALLEAAVRLRCRPEVCTALRAALPPVPPDQLQQYEQTTELYGTCRMLLAGLDKAQLTKVASGWRCNFYDVLEPVRAVRLVNGGRGYNEDLIMELRLLNFEVNNYDP